MWWEISHFKQPVLSEAPWANCKNAMCSSISWCLGPAFAWRVSSECVGLFESSYLPHKRTNSILYITLNVILQYVIYDKCFLCLVLSSVFQMGESGSRRSTLVSRLPIFRRSSSKRQESLPSSPSSGGVGNGVHSSSPSSTNSSSGSTGKRRSLFRAPSLSFAAKRNSEPRVQPINLNLTPPLSQGTDTNGNNQQTIPTSVSTGFSEGGGRPKSRHSFGFGSHKKKITRSQTEDFEKGSSSSSTTNRNVFINCISSSGTNEGDDSGFLDDYSGGSNNKRSSRQKKQLLPKSFSAHHRFSRTSDHHRPPEVNLEPPSSTTITPGAGGLTPGSWPGELLGAGGESSLQSPMISEDRTTAITPSEFIPITEDSVSEVDALPVPSPGSGLDPGPSSVPGPSADTAPPDPPPAAENFSVAVSTSQVACFTLLTVSFWIIQGALESNGLISVDVEHVSVKESL